MTDTQLLLIDLSSLAHPLYHMSASEPDPNWTSTQTVARVRALSTQHPHCAICCDGPGPTFRHALSPRVERGDGKVEGYKAQRPERDARLMHQIDLAIARLRGDGYPIWCVEGFEADDVIAAAVRHALAIEDTTVLIASADKDLLQLVNDRVTFKSTAPKSDGVIRDAAAVKAKFGVTPAQMLDYLCLVGDASDNIVGAKGIGGVIAARLLTAHGSLAALYEKMAHGVVAGVTPALRTALMEFKDRWPVVAQLIALRADIEIPFAEIAAERTAAPMTVDPLEFDPVLDHKHQCSGGHEWVCSESSCEAATALDCYEHSLRFKSRIRLSTDEAKKMAETCERAMDRELPASDAIGAAMRAAAAKAADLHAPASPPAASTSAAAASGTLHSSVPNGGDSGTPPSAKKAAPPQAPVLDPAPSSPRTELVTDFALQLEPRNMPEAVTLAQRMFESRLFSAYGTPQAVLSTILAGRELGIPAMASLRAFHIIEGKPTMAAGTIAALIQKSGHAKYFRCTARTDAAATFVTQRGEDPPVSLTYTLDDGRRAFGFTETMNDKARAELETKWQRSGWGKNPADMCVARASSKLARLVYPDVTAGLYAAEEME